MRRTRERQGSITYRNKQSVVPACQYPTRSHVLCQHWNLNSWYGEQGTVSKSLYQAWGKYEGNKGCFLKNVTRWWWWRLVLTLLHRRNGIRRQRKAHVGVKKPRGVAHVRCQQGDAMRTTQSGRTENRLQHHFEQIGAGYDCICQGQLKGHCSSQDTR